MFEQCIVVDEKNHIRKIHPGEQSAISGFYLIGQGLGDIISMVPVIEKTAQVLGEKLVVWTLQPQVFANNPFVEARLHDDYLRQQACTGGRVLIVLPVEGNGVPTRETMHLIDQAAFTVLPLAPEEHSAHLYPSGTEEERMQRLVEPFLSLPRVIVHVNNTFPIRTWPLQCWQELTNRMLTEGCAVFAVGKCMQYHPNRHFDHEKTVHDLAFVHERFCNVCDQLTIQELYALIGLVSVVVTFDSDVLHVANCTETPIVALFTDINPRFRMRISKTAEIGFKTQALYSACSYQFCQSHYGLNNNRCRHEKTAESFCCMPTVEQVYDAVGSSLGTRICH